MGIAGLIPANEFCRNHDIEYSFINSLQEGGLIEITRIEETDYINENQLFDLERIVRLHYDLDINLEGIETVIHLLNRISDLQDEITRLQNDLRAYEEKPQSF